MLHSSKQIKNDVKLHRDGNLTVDVFRPRLGFVVNPFASSSVHEPPVFVGMTRDGQMTPPLQCLTHKGSEEGCGVLAPVKCYTTIGVRSGKTRTLLFLTLLFLTLVSNCSAHKREKKLFFLYCGFQPRKEKKRRLGFGNFDSQNTAEVHQDVPNFLQPLNPYFCYI